METVIKSVRIEKFLAKAIKNIDLNLSAFVRNELNKLIEKKGRVRKRKKN